MSASWPEQLGQRVRQLLSVGFSAEDVPIGTKHDEGAWLVSGLVNHRVRMPSVSSRSTNPVRPLLSPVGPCGRWPAR